MVRSYLSANKKFIFTVINLFAEIGIIAIWSKLKLTPKRENRRVKLKHCLELVHEGS